MYIYILSLYKTQSAPHTKRSILPLGKTSKVNKGFFHPHNTRSTEIHCVGSVWLGRSYRI